MFAQMDRMEDVGSAAFVQLPVVGVVGNVHGLLGQFCVDHGIHLIIIYSIALPHRKSKPIPHKEKISGQNIPEVIHCGENFLDR